MFESVSPWPLNVSGRNWELSCSACAHPVFVGHSKAMKGKEHRQCCSAGWGRCSFFFLWLHAQSLLIQACMEEKDFALNRDIINIFNKTSLNWRILVIP